MIDASLVVCIAESVAAAACLGDGMALASDLRSRYPGLRVAVCNDDDIPPRLVPAAENTVCRLYYMDTGEHCVKLTSDAAAASGLVVGLIGDDE